MDIKKIDTLFHGTEKLEHLISILENGFYSSYANEKIAGRNTKVLMVSFSNIPLIEARNQVNYGNYFIGLKRSWGITKKLHPVAYTYENSKYENDVYELMQTSAIGQTLPLLKEFNEEGIPFHLSGNFLGLEKLTKQNLSDESLDSLKSFFEEVFSITIRMQLYLKHYIALDKNGNQRFSYNDREWRYIPTNIARPLIYEMDAAGKNHTLEYQEYSNKSKPHFKDNPLEFQIEDISYIVVKEKNDIPIIFKTLEQKFTFEIVNKKIVNGDLTILSMDKILHDL